MSFMLSGCSDLALVYIEETQYFNRALGPNETINIMGRECVWLNYNIAWTTGLRDNLIGFKDEFYRTLRNYNY